MFKGWRTRALSAAVTALALLEYLDPAIIADAIGAENRGMVLLIIAVAIFVLRQLTTTPAGRAE